MTYNVESFTKELDDLDRQWSTRLSCGTSWHRVANAVSTEDRCAHSWNMVLSIDADTTDVVELANKHLSLRLKWELDVDEQVFVGDEAFSVPGLINLPIDDPLLCGREFEANFVDTIASLRPKIALLSPSMYIKYLLEVRPKLSIEQLRKTRSTAVWSPKWLAADIPAIFGKPLGVERAILLNEVSIPLEVPKRHRITAQDGRLHAYYSSSIGSVTGERNVVYLDNYTL